MYKYRHYVVGFNYKWKINEIWYSCVLYSVVIRTHPRSASNKYIYVYTLHELEHKNNRLFSLGFIFTSSLFRCGRIGLFLSTRRCRWSIRMLAGVTTSFIIIALLMIFGTFWSTFWNRLFDPKFRFHRWQLMAIIITFKQTYNTQNGN